MKKYFAFIHQPKKVAAVSLVIAVAAGVFGYIEINRKPASFAVPTVNSGTTAAGDNQNLTLGFLSGGRIESVSVKAGDIVKKGQVLAALDAGNASGALLEAKAAYATAEANYQKIIAGATGPTIDVAKAAVNSAQVNLTSAESQQNTSVANARLSFLNSTLVAKSTTDTSLTPPTVTGTYTKDTEGTISLNINQGNNNGYFTFSGVWSGTGTVSSTVPEPIGDIGLYLEFPSGANLNSYFGTTWNIDIPNQTAANYLTNYNAYQTALQNQSQAVKAAQAALDQANASLSALVATARPEDVAAAQAQVDNASGAVQIAEAVYENTIITAPEDGIIVAVSIAPGQIAVPNAPAIEFLGQTTNN